MAISDEYGRSDRYEYSGGGKLPEGYRPQEPGFTSYRHKQVSWEEAKAYAEQGRMQTWKARKYKNLEDKLEK